MGVAVSPSNGELAGNRPGTGTLAIQRWLKPMRRTIAALSLGSVLYVTTALLLATVAGLSRHREGSSWESTVLFRWPVETLEPFRIANQYGLFAVMTHERYEIEFQGSNDGQSWIAYPFRYKPQDIHRAPGIYAPYQPRFEWNLWFASLGNWRSYQWVVLTEERLLRN